MSDTRKDFRDTYWKAQFTACLAIPYLLGLGALHWLSWETSTGGGVSPILGIIIAFYYFGAVPIAIYGGIYSIPYYFYDSKDLARSRTVDWTPKWQWWVLAHFALTPIVAALFYLDHRRRKTGYPTTDQMREFLKFY